MKKWNILIILVVAILIPCGSSELSVGVDGTIGIDLIPVTPINYSTISTNYSTYAGDAHLFDGYSSSGLYSYYKSMFDSVYATISSLANYLPLTGGTMTGDINMGGKDITGVGGIDMAGNIDMNYNNINNIQNISYNGTLMVVIE